MMETLKSLGDWEKRPALLVPQNPAQEERTREASAILEILPGLLQALPLPTVW